MGGAFTIVSLFANTLRINQDDPLSNVLLVSMSFIAGGVGKQLFQLAGKTFLRQAEEAGRAAGEKAAEQIVREDPVAGAAYEKAVTELVNKGRLTEALEIIEQLLKYNPTNIWALIEKARAFKRLKKVQAALEIIDQALRVKPNDNRLLYNRACYMAILKMSTEKILADLKRSASRSLSIVKKPETRRS